MEKINLSIQLKNCVIMKKLCPLSTTTTGVVLVENTVIQVIAVLEIN